MLPIHTIKTAPPAPGQRLASPISMYVFLLITHLQIQTDLIEVHLMRIHEKHIFGPPYVRYILFRVDHESPWSIRWTERSSLNTLYTRTQRLTLLFCASEYLWVFFILYLQYSIEIVNQTRYEYKFIHSPSNQTQDLPQTGTACAGYKQLLIVKVLSAVSGSKRK